MGPITLLTGLTLPDAASPALSAKSVGVRSHLAIWWVGVSGCFRGLLGQSVYDVQYPVSDV